MPKTYMLRAIEDDLWNAFRARAEREGHKLRWVMMALVKLYVTQGLPKQD